MDWLVIIKTFVLSTFAQFEIVFDSLVRGCYSISTLHEIGKQILLWCVCNHLNVYILKPDEKLHRKRHQTNEWDDQFFFIVWHFICDRLCWYNIISAKPTRKKKNPPLPWKMISSTLSYYLIFVSSSFHIDFYPSLMRYFSPSWSYFYSILLPISFIFSHSLVDRSGWLCMSVCLSACCIYILIRMKPHILSARRTMMDMTRVPKCGILSPSQTMNWIHNGSRNESQL